MKQINIHDGQDTNARTVIVQVTEASEIETDVSFDLHNDDASITKDSCMQTDRNYELTNSISTSTDNATIENLSTGNKEINDSNNKRNIVNNHEQQFTSNVTNSEIIASIPSSDIKMYMDLITRNSQLLSTTNTTRNSFAYYSFKLYEPDQKLMDFTISGSSSFFGMLQLVFDDADEFSFFNFGNTLLFDTQNSRIVTNITKMFRNKRLTYKNWTSSLSTILQDNWYDILCFCNSKFYLLKYKKIFYINDNINDYFNCTKRYHIRNKCDLCKRNKFEFVLENDFVLNSSFCRFCKKCYKLIYKLPTA